MEVLQATPVLHAGLLHTPRGAQTITEPCTPLRWSCVVGCSGTTTWCWVQGFSCTQPGVACGATARPRGTVQTVTDALHIILVVARGLTAHLRVLHSATESLFTAGVNHRRISAHPLHDADPPHPRDAVWNDTDPQHTNIVLLGRTLHTPLVLHK